MLDKLCSRFANLEMHGKGTFIDARNAAGQFAVAAKSGFGNVRSPDDQIWDAWRLQTTLFTDVPIGGWGRNQTFGYGGTLAVIRFWI